MKPSLTYPQRIAVASIVLYQRTLSPDHGWFRSRYPYGFCRYYPSCSEYARQAVIQRGVVSGVVLALSRIIRCNPWAQPRVDTIN